MKSVRSRYVCKYFCKFVWQISPSFLPSLSRRLKGHYWEYWAWKILIFRFQPHYCENHKVVSLIEPDTGCKLIRVGAQGPLSALITMEKLATFFPPKQWLAPCYSYWVRLASLAPNIGATLWLHEWVLAGFSYFITMMTLEQLLWPWGQEKDMLPLGLTDEGV